MPVGGARPGAGRPKGRRNNATLEQKSTLQDLARRHTAEALKTLVQVATMGESETARVSAAIAILDRGYGRPAQAVQHTGPNNGPILTADLTKATDDELRALEAVFGPLAGEPGGDDGGDPGGEGEADG